MPQFNGTVVKNPLFNAKSSAETLHNAMKGFGCDDKGVNNVLCHRTNSERQNIAAVFKQMYGKDLMKTLIDELKGKQEDVIVALMQQSAAYDASELKKAMKGIGTNEDTLIEIMCTRTNAEIQSIKRFYSMQYKKSLEADLASETSGSFKRLLVSMTAAARDESAHTDRVKAYADAYALFRAGVTRLGTDDATFNKILASNNINQLNLVFQEYQKLAGHDIEKAISDEFSGDIKTGLLTIIKVVKNRPGYFAQKLYESMKGLGTKDDVLIRIVVTRCEVDMVQIKQEFQRMYGKSLSSMIKIVKFRDFKDTEVRVTEFDTNTHNVKNAVEKLDKDIQKLKATVRTLEQDARTQVRLGNKVRAMHILRQKQLVTKQLDDKDEQYSKLSMLVHLLSQTNDHRHGDTSGSYKNALITLVDG